MKYIGVDFGTTRSSVVIYDNETENVTKVGKPVVSVAAIKKDDGLIKVGDAVTPVMMNDAYEYIPSLKELLVKGYRYEIGDRAITEVDLIAEFLQLLKVQTLRVHQNLSFDNIVMAIPNDFPLERRSRLREAAAKKGINIKFFVNEPLAAYFANYDSLKNCSNIAVFDWGGGTLDVTIARQNGGEIVELSKNRLDKAGNEITDRLANCIHYWISEEKNSSKNLRDMPRNLQIQMKGAVENIKISLNSENDEELFTFLNYGDFGTVRRNITREEFNSCIEYIVDKAISVLEDAIEDSKLGISGIDKILLVGGSSKLFLLQSKLKEKFGDKLLLSKVDSDWGVAIGAAMLNATPGAYMVSKNVSLRLSDNNEFPLITEGKNISEYTKDNATSIVFGKVDGKSGACFVFTGDADIDKSANKYLIVNTNGILDEKIELKAYIDENLIVKVEAVCQGSANVEGNRGEWTYTNLKCSYKLPQV